MTQEVAIDIPDDLDKFMERPTQRRVTVERAGGLAEITVDIEYNLPEHKPFLGGYKNRTTGFEFHHVAGQTALLPHQRGLDKLIDKFHRACQTQITTNDNAQTAREFGCQTPFFHQFINDEYPSLEAKEYVLAVDEINMREVSALKIQRVTRGLFARQTVSKMRDELAEEKHKMEEREKQVQADLAHKRDVEIRRRTDPRTATDFKVLSEELATWHMRKTQKIQEGNYTDEERQRKLKKLLAQETELLRTIDKMKIKAKKANTEYRDDHQLHDLSKKKLWQLTNGEVVKVRTPNSMRAKELRGLFGSLKETRLTADERIDVLLRVKQTVKEFNCQLTRDMIALIDREADLLNRGRSEAALQGLRKRIQTLFLQFCRTPEFNPEAAVLEMVPQNIESVQ